MRNRARSAALLAGLALTLSAVPAVAQDEDATITYRNWFHGGSMETVWNDYIASYEALHPGLTVEVQTIPFPRYNDVLTVELAAGDPPDVAWINASVGPQWVKSGRLVDLHAADARGLRPRGLRCGTGPVDGDGALYALPFTNAGNLVYYNTDAFEAAGLPTPVEMSRTASGPGRTSSRPRRPSGGRGHRLRLPTSTTTSSRTGWRNLIEIWSAYGGGPWTVDGTKCTFNSPETKEATQIVWDMIYTDGTHPGPGEAADFAAGNIGMMLGRQNVAPRLAEVPFGWDVVPPPSGPAGFVPSLAQNGVVAFADSDNPDLAGGFVAPCHEQGERSQVRRQHAGGAQVPPDARHHRREQPAVHPRAARAGGPARCCRRRTSAWSTSTRTTRPSRRPHSWSSTARSGTRTPTCLGGTRPGLLGRRRLHEPQLRRPKANRMSSVLARR